MKYLLTLLLLLFTVPALATIAELRWLPPTGVEIICTNAAGVTIRVVE